MGGHESSQDTYRPARAAVGEVRAGLAKSSSPTAGNYKEVDMDTSHDKVTLTGEERHILAALEEAAGRHGLHHRLSLTLAARATGLRSSRLRHEGTVLLFVAGVALMVATFTRWPAVAVLDVAMQACALWWGAHLSGPAPWSADLRKLETPPRHRADDPKGNEPAVRLVRRRPARRRWDG
jgi:hypothetical protein